jgi:hypothetical protein
MHSGKDADKFDTTSRGDVKIVDSSWFFCPWSLKVQYTCMLFFVVVFCRDQTSRPNNKVFEYFRFILEFYDIFDFFTSMRWLSWCGSMPSETPWHLSHAKWDSTQLSQCGIWNLWRYWRIPRWLRWREVSLRADSVDVLTQLIGSLIPRRLSVQIN